MAPIDPKTPRRRIEDIDLEKEVDEGIGSDDRTGADGEEYTNDKGKRQNMHWNDDILIQIFKDLKAPSFDLPCYLKAIKLFWAKYTGASEVQGLSEIMLYILTTTPTLGKSSEPFLVFPPKKEGKEETAKPIMDSSTIFGMEDVKGDINLEGYDPTQDLSGAGSIDKTKVSHTLAAEDSQDLNLPTGTHDQNKQDQETEDQEMKYPFLERILELLRLIYPEKGEGSPKEKREKNKEDKDPTSDTSASDDLPSEPVWLNNFYKLSQATIYVALLCLRRLVKTDLQFLGAFSKERFHMNYQNLMTHTIQEELPAPHGRFNKYMEKELKRGSWTTTAMVALCLNTYISASKGGFDTDIVSQKSNKKTTAGILEATCLVHMKGNGMSLYFMIMTVCSILSLQLGEVLKMFCYKNTARGMMAIVVFHKHIHKSNKVAAVYWSRLLDEGFHSSLAPDNDHILAYALAYFLDTIKPPEDDSGLLKALWIKKCAKPHQEAGIQIAKIALGCLPSKSLIPASSITRQAGAQNPQLLQLQRAQTSEDSANESSEEDERNSHPSPNSDRFRGLDED